ncbi:DctP family TRAP transporter solute-binding subunit [Neobacillus cucumis]|uniref:DctP family TRAP transporter solute-binding subunit n=1 Tax=Neobacillus cucumis TaxID=1740721 RepID=UPI0028536941|nr:DctP family TRAP transporter solute-binding subunit [Neobacillus cucumis]MDR4946534.1 DctP family TRAP transporter solute-binding subunit [Neobacillus cucumis]
MQITIGHLNPVDSAYHEAAKVFKNVLERMTEGKIKVRIIPELSLSGGELISDVQNGQLDIGITASSALGNLVPITNAFDFPYLFRNIQHAYRVLDGKIGDFVNEQIEEVGLKNLAWWENGFRHITTCCRPITKPEDLRGLDFRTMDNEIHRTLFQVWGANPISVPLYELYDALKNGTVDGQENPLGIIIPNRFHEVQSYLTLTGHVYSPALFVMNKEVYDCYPWDIKEKILHAANISRDFERNFLRRNTPVYLQIARKIGMQILTKNDIDFPAFVSTSKEVYTLLGKPYRSIHQEIRAMQGFLF